MSRKAGDTVAIGDQVVIKIVEIRGGKVRLGIEAPPELKIEASEGPQPPEPQGK